MHPQNTSAFLPGPVQTNNRAELKPMCIITDSKYVYDGVTAHMHRWALRGTQVSNHNLWDSLRSVLHSRSGETLWKHVYSHVGVLGNERADALANQGRIRHPGRLQFLRDLCLRQGVRPVILPSSCCYFSCISPSSLFSHLSWLVG